MMPDGLWRCSTHVIEGDAIPAPMTGREAARQFMQIHVRAFPDLSLDNEHCPS